ncbi:protein cordon-bleu isoform X2 [Spea bombifrons]|uniref:protein cordon-bleu isoform X2 n=1 Tax=Spea bombifrons TaxID=233779 RepID=UPI002349D766|nr:protein cordon-bleu isoform X2 [Spea bombifrons]
MSCIVLWHPVNDYGFSDAEVPQFSDSKRLSSSLGDLTGDKPRHSQGIGVHLGSYIITSRKKMKARAPSPPSQPPAPKPLAKQNSFSDSEGTGNQSSEDFKDNILNRKVDLRICLPDGQERLETVDGSKAVMDLLVDLCSQYHLNPAYYTLEVRPGASKHMLKPNTSIGTLDIQTLCLKEKVPDVKVRKPPPRIPEKTVRLVVNFLGTQKAVVRVNPNVPLKSILPAVCEKCEFTYEDVILLRDVITKEELDMSKSLNDLCLKELYVWNCKQEKRGNLPTSNDTVEKEKKGILGFFRSHKKNIKNEGHIRAMDSDDYEDVLKSKIAGESTWEEVSTTPSSPSVKSPPVALGTSLSLSNICGIDALPEVKKRRAPPPPRVASQETIIAKSLEEKEEDQLYAVVQRDQQKKKRRAPPPPIPQRPNDTNEERKNGKSTSGNGRQVPQKPPRGITRSPPQLIIPPPPPYPPPDNGIMDPPVFANGAVITGPNKHAPVPAKRDKSLIHLRRVSSDEALLVDSGEADENQSGDRYTEELSKANPAPNTISLDLHNDEPKSKAEVTTKEGALKPNMNIVYMEPIRPEFFSDEKLEGQQTSTSGNECDVASVKNGDEDVYIASQFQHTFVELDEDSEDGEDSAIHFSSYVDSCPSPNNKHGKSNDINNRTDIVIDVPVTIIDEVPDINNYYLENNTDKTIAVEVCNLQQTSGLKKVNSKTIDNYGNSNVASISPAVETHGSKEHEDTFLPATYRLDHNATVHVPENVNIIKDAKPTFSSPPIIPSKEIQKMKERADIVNEKKETGKIKIMTEETLPVEYHGSKALEYPKAPLWRQHTLEPKVGMTTFTVFPPKPDLKKYDRGASISASAIKIDDFGNLVTPQSSMEKKEMLSNETEGPLVERAKEFWRSNSIDKPAGESKEQPAKKAVPLKSRKENYNEPKNKLCSIPPKRLTQQTFNDTLDCRTNVLQQTKSVQPTAVSQQKVIIIENTNKMRTDLPFLKPIKRTSSQYVASAICKYTEPLIGKSLEPADARQERGSDNKNPSSRNNSIVEDQKVQGSSANKQRTSTEKEKVLRDNSLLETQINSKVEPTKKCNSNYQLQVNGKIDHISSGDHVPVESQSTEGKKSLTIPILEKEHKKLNSVFSSSDSRAQLTFRSPSNAFLEAVREKSAKNEQLHSYGLNKDPIVSVPITEKEKKSDTILSTITDEPDSAGNSNIFGPKAKIRPVVQKPLQKDTSLHSALMDSIQNGEGKQKLRKIQVKFGR